MKPHMVLLLLAAISFSSCNYWGGKRVRGNGISATQQRSVGAFSGIEVRGGYDVYLSQSTDNTLKIEGDENLLPYIEIEKEGDVLRIGSRSGFNLQPRTGIKIYASAPVFKKLMISGSGDIVSQSKITSSNAINAQIRGSGDITLDIEAPVFEAGISGSGDIKVSGSTRNFKGSIMGSGNIKCFDLLSEKSDIDIAGSGDAQVYASKELNVDIKGAGDVQYKGTPSVSQSIKGAGSVTKAG